MFLLLPVQLVSQVKYVVVVKPSNNTETAIKVECNGKSSHSLNLKACFEFNSDSEVVGMTLSYTSDAPNRFAGLWFPNDSINYKGINKYFERNERGLTIGPIVSKQVKKGVLYDGIIRPALCSQNASLNDGTCFLESFGNNKNDLDNHIFTLEDDSKLTASFTVINNADSIIIRLNNLIPLTISRGTSQYFKKYYLNYIAKDIEIVVMIDRDGCVDNLEDIAYLDNMLAYYNKYDAHLAQISKNCNDEDEYEKFKANVLSGYDRNMLDYLRDTQCERLNTRLDSLDKIISVIRHRKCTYCDKYTQELQSNYNVLDKKYQYLYALYQIQPRTDDVIERFDDGKSDANRYIRNLDLKKYEGLECPDVVKELNNINSKIKQIRKLIVNRCNMTKNQADALSDEIREANKIINKKVNQYSVINDVSQKLYIKSEIMSTTTSIDDKVKALHSDCMDKFKDLKESVTAYDEVKKLCKKKGIIND